MTPQNKLIDHTLLAVNASQQQVEKLCQEAIDYDFFSVCVSPRRVAIAHKILEKSDVRVCTVVGFPSGAHTTAVKAFETRDAVENGADEIDMVISLGSIADGNWDDVRADIEAVVEAAQGRLVKVILETCLLTDEEIARASTISVDAGADFVKTSTGFSSGGATTHAVAIMRSVVGDSAGVKASGGIKTYQDLKAMVDAGATRIGASSGVEILKEN